MFYFISSTYSCIFDYCKFVLNIDLKQTIQKKTEELKFSKKATLRFC